MNFKFHNPYITPQEKVNFLNLFIAPSILALDVKSNRFYPKVWRMEDNMLCSRLNHWIKTGSISAGSYRFDSEQEKSQFLIRVQEFIEALNASFNVYVQSNETITQRLSRLIHVADENTSSEHLDVLTIENADEDILTRSNPYIYNVNKNWRITDAQLSYIVKNQHQLKGICAFDVGLGKTSVALILSQVLQNKGLKKKTLFVMPQSTLSKYRKEAYLGSENKPAIFVSDADAIFISQKQADADLKKALDPKYRKVFMSYEAFFRLRVRQSSLENYLQYLIDHNDSFSAALESESAKAIGFVAKLSKVMGNQAGKTKEELYFEDFQFDSLFIDELHFYKNSKEIFSTLNVKYLSVPPLAKKGIDAQAKAWLIRQYNLKQTGKEDGILGLTATPLTNSPLEIYSLLTMIVGEKEVNKMIGLSSSDDFLHSSCEIVNENDFTVDGREKVYSVFKGVRNLTILRKAIGKVITFLSQEDVRETQLKLPIPEREMHFCEVKMTATQKAKVDLYRHAYSLAKRVLFAKTQEEADSITHSLEWRSYVEPVMKMFHESIEIIGSPFNFIHKMERLLLDSDLDEQGLSFFIRHPLKYQDAITKTIANIKEKKFKQLVYRLPKHTTTDQILTQKNSEEEIVFEIQSALHRLPFITDELFSQQQEMDYLAYFNQTLGTHYDSFHHLTTEFQRLFLDDTTYAVQVFTYQALIKNGVPADDICFIASSNKVFELISKIKEELHHPRGVLFPENIPSAVKQIVFCDHLGLHFKLEKLLSQYVEKIAIITGQTNQSPEEVLAVQESFNSQNGYTLVIANEKAQEGIDLQNGTQATHLLTIGWTPDSTHQRLGRGGRAGNATKVMRAYFYDTENSFDHYKRRLVDKKADWIQRMIDPNGEDFVEIDTHLSREDYDALIRELGSDSYSDLERRIEEERKTKRLRRIIQEQKAYLRFMSNAKKIKANSTEELFLTKVEQVLALHKQYRELLKKHSAIEKYRLHFPWQYAFDLTFTKVEKNTFTISSDIFTKVDVDPTLFYTNRFEQLYALRAKVLNELLNEFDFSFVSKYEAQYQRGTDNRILFLFKLIQDEKLDSVPYIVDLSSLILKTDNNTISQDTLYQSAKDAYLVLCEENTLPAHLVEKAEQCVLFEKRGEFIYPGCYLFTQTHAVENDWKYFCQMVQEQARFYGSSKFTESFFKNYQSFSVLPFFNIEDFKEAFNAFNVLFDNLHSKFNGLDEVSFRHLVHSQFNQLNGKLHFDLHEVLDEERFICWTAIFPIGSKSLYRSSESYWEQRQTYSFFTKVVYPEDMPNIEKYKYLTALSSCYNFCLTSSGISLSLLQSLNEKLKTPSIWKALVQKGILPLKDAFDLNFLNKLIH